MGGDDRFGFDRDRFRNRERDDCCGRRDHFDPRFEWRFDPQFDQRFDPRFERRFEPRFERRFEPRFDRDFRRHREHHRGNIGRDDELFFRFPR